MYEFLADRPDDNQYVLRAKKIARGEDVDASKEMIIALLIEVLRVMDKQ